MQVYEYDENGIFVEPVILSENEELPPNMTFNRPDGFYKPKWTGTKWIEGLSQGELDEMEYQQYLNSLKPSDEEIKNAQLELVILNLLIDMEVM